MKLLKSELDLACSTVLAALQVLARLRSDVVSFDLGAQLPKEMKAAADQVLESVIVDHLRVTGLDILSEESGQIVNGSGDCLRWVVDPLDGTVNYIRGLGPCSVSLALCCGDAPVFGVIGEFPSGKLAWGGVGYGAFWSSNPIQVSMVSERRQAIICTGFPSRFKFDAKGLDWIASTMGAYAKVRMLGAASLSLLHVAKGAAEVYAERNIMIWDVAAGLAIVEGAGGGFSIAKSQDHVSYNVFASNGLIGDC
jgi:myo-inositol-1(or 4)-monophosphatase